MQSLLSFTHSVIPNLYDFFFPPKLLYIFFAKIDNIGPC